jgi:hypothetical protein
MPSQASVFCGRYLYTTDLMAALDKQSIEQDWETDIDGVTAWTFEDGSRITVFGRTPRLVSREVTVE